VAAHDFKPDRRRTRHQQIEQVFNKSTTASEANIRVTSHPYSVAKLVSVCALTFRILAVIAKIQRENATLQAIMGIISLRDKIRTL
jgi:hypothetical protein